MKVKHLEDFLSKKLSYSERVKLADKIKVPKSHENEWQAVKRVYTDKRFYATMKQSPDFALDCHSVNVAVTRLLLDLT
ncbi:MAG: hypothetical protein NXI25_20755 [bacterium]|nr:hypothetical protein [bacterium]